MANATQASSTLGVDREHLDSVRGEIAFARRTSDEGPAVEIASFAEAPRVIHEVAIRDARPIVSELSLDREGFALIEHKMSCANERDPEILCSKYLDEMALFIKSYFNASWVTRYRQGKLNGAIMRSADQAKVSGPVRGRASSAHIDFSPIAAPVVAAISQQNNGLPIRSYSRLMVIQTWQALSPPPQDFPLAFCDGGSVLDTDLIDTYHRDSATNVTHKTWVLHYSPLHRWYYFPEMTSDEFILFKGYDSEDNCNPRSAHSSFDNRRAHPNARPRESIETRFFVYYE